MNPNERAISVELLKRIRGFLISVFDDDDVGPFYAKNFRRLEIQISELIEGKKPRES